MISDWYSMASNLQGCKTSWWPRSSVQWDDFVVMYRCDTKYYVVSRAHVTSNEITQIAGPFETLDVAKAACILMESNT